MHHVSVGDLNNSSSSLRAASQAGDNGDYPETVPYFLHSAHWSFTYWPNSSSWRGGQSSVQKKSLLCFLSLTRSQNVKP